MSEAEWLAGDNPLPLFQYAQDDITERKLRLFAIAALNTMRERNLESIARSEVAEHFADGLMTISDLRSSWPQMQPSSPTTAPELAYEWAELIVMAKDRGYYGGSFPVLDETWVTHFLRDIVGNPFQPFTFNPCWLTSIVLAIARQMYESRDFSPMPILADALQDAGCDNEDILSHCRSDGPHVKGCWVVDLILGKK
jgi:hypothetical protein